MTTPEPSVSLRPLEPGDAEVLASWGADPVFVAHAEWAPRTPEETLGFWQSRVERSPDGLVRLAAVADGVLVGYADLFGHDPAWRELGYAVGPRSAWGRGLGTRIAALMVDHAFDVLGLQEVRAEAYDANPASVRILERIGMTEVGRGEDDEFLGEPTHLRVFSVRVEDWRPLIPHPR